MGDLKKLNSIMISPNSVSYDERHKNFLQYLVEPEEADVIIYGVPFDGGTQRHVGTNEGPIGIRHALSFFRNWSSELDLCFTDFIKTADIGNVDMLWYDYDFTFKNVDKVMTNILENKKFPITLGGDHSITYRAIKSVINHNPNKKIGLIWLDNHLDTMEDYHGDIYHCGTPLWHLMSEFPDQIKAKNVVHMGSRGFQLGKKGWENQKKLGFPMIKAQEIKFDGIRNAVQKAVGLAQDDTDLIYMTLDIDVAEGIYAPGTQCNNPGGLNATELFYILREVAMKTNLVGFDVMEVAPRADVADVTIQLGACSVLEVISGLAWRKREGLKK